MNGRARDRNGAVDGGVWDVNAGSVRCSGGEREYAVDSRGSAARMDAALT